MARYILGLPLVLALITGCASVAVINEVPRIESRRNVINSPLVEVKNVDAELSPGQVIGALQYGWACIPSASNNWKGREMTTRKQEMIRIVRDELEKIGYKVKDPEKISSDQDGLKPDFSIVGDIVEMKANICYPDAGFGMYNKAQGNAYMKVRWTVYDAVGASVLSFTTEGGANVKDTLSSSADELYYVPFGIASANIGGSDEFYNLMKGK